MDEDFEAHLVVVVVECQKRDSQTDSTIIYIDITDKLKNIKSNQCQEVSFILR